MNIKKVIIYTEDGHTYTLTNPTKFNLSVTQPVYPKYWRSAIEPIGYESGELTFSLQAEFLHGTYEQK